MIEIFLLRINLGNNYISERVVSSFLFVSETDIWTWFDQRLINSYYIFDVRLILHELIEQIQANCYVRIMTIVSFTL